MSAIAELRIVAARKAEELGLLDAVRTIAQQGSQRSDSEWVNLWNGLKFFYGERFGDSDRAYAEACHLQYSKTHPVHAENKAGEIHRPGNPDDAVTGVEVVYRHEDIHQVPETTCLREGPWIDKVVAEAKRIGIVAKCPSKTGADKLAEEQDRFKPFSG